MDLFAGGDALTRARPASGASQAAVSVNEQAATQRKALGIRVAGAPAPPLLTDFQQLAEAPLGASAALLARLSAEGWLAPTAVQRQAIPCLLAQQELLVCAPTGSGKTLAFLLPLLLLLRSHSPGGPRALVLAPTRELATQTKRVWARICPGKTLRCTVLSKASAAGCDLGSVDLLVSTPLRLGHLLAAGKASLSSVLYVVLDEADKLFELGFVGQLDCVLAACTHERLLRSLFTATLPEGVETLARSVMHAPVRVTVGERNAAAATVSQRLLFCGNEQGKLLAVRNLLREGTRPPILVFTQSKERCAALARELRMDAIPSAAIHADMSQSKRDAAVASFRCGDTWLLVATDLLARGLDFIGVQTVVNYDFPDSPTAYVHRIGRCGRAGRSGEAVTLFTEADAPQLRAIANVMRASGCDVPAWMLGLQKGPKQTRAVERAPIGGQDRFDRLQKRKKRSMVDASKRRVAASADVAEEP